MSDEKNAAPPDFSEKIITEPDGIVPPMAKLHRAFRQLDGDFQAMAKALQEVEAERAQLVWALMMLVKQADGERVVISKAMAAALDPRAVLESAESPLGWTFWVANKGEPDAKRNPAAVDRH